MQNRLVAAMVGRGLALALSSIALALGLAATPAAGLTPIASLTAAPDVTVTLAGVLVEDQQVAVDDLQGSVYVQAPGALAGALALDAYDDPFDGTVLFSLETSADLGGTVFGPADVVRWNGAIFTLAFDAGAAGVPAGANVDAMTLDGTDFLLSFDVAVDLPGGSYGDEDLVRWNGLAFSLAFDGSAAGIAESHDLDGAHRLTNGHLLLSFDTSGSVGGIEFADEDALEYTPLGGIWELAYDGSVEHAAWAPAAVEALAAREPQQIPPAGSLQFSQAAYSELETAGFAVITVTRVGGTSGEVGVTYATADGTATDGFDYTGVTATLTWLNGDAAPKTFQVPILDDPDLEPDETVLLSLSAPTGGAVLGTPSAAILTILDDESRVSVLEIPTLEGWALALLAALLAGASVVLLWQRSRNQAIARPNRGDEP